MTRIAKWSLAAVALGAMALAGGARAADVLSLMRLMRSAVRERFGVTLMPEVELLGLKWD